MAKRSFMSGEGSQLGWLSGTNVGQEGDGSAC